MLMGWVSRSEFPSNPLSKLSWITFEQGGDYLLTVKGNQKDRHQTLEKLFEKQPFSPSAHAEDPSADTGAQLRADRNPTP